MKKLVAFRVLVEHFLKFFRHRAPVLAFVVFQLKLHSIAQLDPERVANRFVRADIEALAVRKHGALKRQLSVCGANNAAGAVLDLEFLRDIFWNGEIKTAPFVSRFG